MIKEAKRLLLVLFVVFVYAPSSVFALSDAQKQVFDLGINYFNVESSLSSCSVDLSVNLSGDSAAEVAYNFFVSQGLTPTQSAGVVGNLKLESGLDPENIQNPAGRSQNPADAGSKGWGIAQWTPGSKALNIAQSAGITTPIYDLATQLEMVWAQLNGQAGSYSEKQAGDDIKSTTTLLDAVLAFQGNDGLSAGKYSGHFHGFERPADEAASVPRRLVLANSALNSFGGSTGGSATDIASETGCSPTGPGQNTQYINGFTAYSQYDPAWASKPYGNSTIAASGCGPSAMAMIVTALTGQSVTPDQTAAYADSQGLYVNGEGSSWSIGRVLATHWGLKSTLVPADVSTISAVLQTGALVIVAGKGPVPFTSGGHFIVIRGVTSDGNWMVGDSAHPEANTTSWSPSAVLAGVISNGSDGSIYAISK